MTIEKAKIIKIINELVQFFFKFNIMNLHIDIQYDKSHVKIVLEGVVKNLPQKDLDKIKKVLNEPRQEELDEYYWNLAGDNRHPELNLFGTLVDNADVEYNDNTLRVIVTSKI